jgi:endoglucanase
VTGCRFLAGVFALACGLGFCLPAVDAAATGFKRGATLVEFFVFPLTIGEGQSKTYADPPYRDTQAALQTFDFAGLRRIGFDHMRIPVDVGPLMWGGEDRRRAFLQHLGSVLAELHRHELGAVVTLHPPSLQRELPETYLDGLEGLKFRRYLDVVERIAGELKTVRSGRVALEPMNEPQSECRRKNGVDWTVYQELMVSRIRGIAPELPVFLTGGCWSNIEGIVLLDTDLLRDRRNLVSVHFYYPFLFTHQTAHWTMPYLSGVIGVPYPAAEGSLELTLSLTRERFRKIALPASVNPITTQFRADREIQKYFYEAQGRAHVERWMQQVADWQRRQRVASDRIVFTEFGAMKQKVDGVEIDKGSRVRWLRDASSTIERHGWGWTVYVLRDDPFGLYERKSDRYPDPQLLRALRLEVPADDPRE